MADKLTCDLCNGQKEVVEIRIVATLKTCERLECGHWWHIALSRLGSGDAASHKECDCSDYMRPAMKQVAL